MRLPVLEVSGIDDIKRFQAVDFSDRALPESTYQILQLGAQRHGERIAMRFLPSGDPQQPSIDISYQQLLGRVNQTANAFHQLGITKDDVVSMLLPNLPQTHFVIWGGEAAGIVNPLNPLLESAHIAAIMNEAESKVLVTVGPELNAELWEKSVALLDLVPSLEAIVTVDPPDNMDGNHLNERVINFDRAISEQVPHTLVSGRQIAASDIASYFHTGGTTGTPKLAPHTHANEVASSWQIAVAANLNESSVGFTGLPLFHVNAVFVTGMATWLAGGETVLATAAGYRTPEVMINFWSLIEKYKVSYFSCVPTILSALMDVPSDKHDLSSLDFALCGAAPLATELFRKFEEKTGLRILEGYGQTEGTVASTFNPKYGTPKIGSVGVPLPYCDVRIMEVDEEGQYIRECDVNETGAITISGPNVFAGYKQVEQNSGLWPQPGWFNSGDLGRIDEDGYLWLTGRSKDLIIRGGHNIDPQMIEEALFKHGDIAQAVAVGKPDKRVGELPVAFVQLNPGAVLTEQQLLSFAAEHIQERAAVPKEIHFVEQMPVTAVGKIFKPTLRNQLVEGMVKTQLAEGNIPFEQVEVEQDKKYGQKVTVIAETYNHQAIVELLGGYAFYLEVS